MKRIAAILTALCLMAACLPAWAAQSRSQVGTDVSAFSSTDIEGNPIDGSVFSEYSASVVCYFAMWSPDCLDQLALLQSIREENADYGVFGLLLVDATSTVQSALEYMNGEGYTFTVFVCDETWQSIVDESVFIPQSFIVSSSGIVVEAWQAAFQSSDILRERLAFWAGTVLADGDVDLDGEVTIQDALIVLRCALGLLEPSQEYLLHGDADGSGALDIGDALRILRMALGLV